jgi:squalene-hopene/tetraprenyl-beta-curcumene cyclase
MAETYYSLSLREMAGVRAIRQKAMHPHPSLSQRVLKRLLVISVLGGSLLAAPDAPAIGPDPAKLEQAVDRAIGYLETAQADDGSFSNHAGPGVTAVVTIGLLRNGRSPDDPMVARALAYLRQNVRDDGGVYQLGSQVRNYETCLALTTFAEANRDGRYDSLIRDAEKYVKGLQWDESEEIDLSDMSYGGAGYGKHSRPDLSNTSFLIDALHGVGQGADDPAIQKALIFVSRCQNLETQYNTSKFAAKVNDGGFYYTIAAGGSSQAGETPDGGLRSYGSMTYAGLKSMIFAGVGPDDPRVKAAVQWIRRHYTLTENPGMQAAGLYYYYHTFAKALATLGDDQFEDAQGTKHDWRKELTDQLVALQNKDGSWVNGTTRWLEGDPNLVTGYCLMALSYCQPPAATP